MYYRFSKFTKFAIIFSAVMTASVMVFHSYNIHRIIESNKLIFKEMADKNVLRETAIRYLENEGMDLFVGGEFSTIAGLIMGIFALISLYRFSRDNSFAFAVASAFFCFLTTFLCGILLFFVIFSGKSEVPGKNGVRKHNSQWERYVSKKSRE